MLRQSLADEHSDKKFIMKEKVPHCQASIAELL